MYHPPSTAISNYLQISHFVRARRRRRADRVGRVPCMVEHFESPRDSKALANGVFRRALSSTVRRVRPSTSPCMWSRWRWHERLHCLPQQAQREVPLGGRAARDRRYIPTADEHARRPRPCRMMLRHHMLTAWRAGVDPACGEQKMVHELLACATSCAHIRSWVWTYYVYAV